MPFHPLVRSFATDAPLGALRRWLGVLLALTCVFWSAVSLAQAPDQTIRFAGPGGEAIEGGSGCPRLPGRVTSDP